MEDEKRAFARILGANVDALRRMRGMSRDDLAEMAGVSVTTVNNCIYARHAMSAWTVLRLARALGVGVGSLMSREMMGD